MFEALDAALGDDGSRYIASAADWHKITTNVIHLILQCATSSALQTDCLKLINTSCLHAA